MVNTKRETQVLFVGVLLAGGLSALSGVAQKPVTLGLDSFEGLTVDAPGGYTLAEYSFDSVPVRNGERAQGLTVTLSTGDGLIFYCPAIETGPGDVLVECSVWCSGPDVGLALVAMNLPDYSMMANLPTNGAEYLGGWQTMRLIDSPKADTIMPAFQVVSAGNTTIVVWVDEITVTPIQSLEPEQVLELFGMDIFTPPVDDEHEITINLPSLPNLAGPLEMVLIDPGTFTMGSPSSERGRDSDETQHQVTITQAFYLGKYMVTQAQWESVMGSNPATGSGVGNNYPVYTVSWNDCQIFIENLNGMGLGTFRLPTEAEWEYACRARTQTRFYWGDDLNDSEIVDYAWYGGNNSPSGTKEVGQKQSNAFGLFDMSGNVYEWCSDWYGSYPSGPQVDPQGPSTGSDRVGRGGRWTYYAQHCRSAYRHGVSPNHRGNIIGFRLVREFP